MRWRERGREGGRGKKGEGRRGREGGNKRGNTKIK